MSLFNIAVTVTVSQSCYDQIMSKTEVPSASNLAGAAAKRFNVHGTMRVVVGAHKWAQRAKKSLKEKAN